MMKPSIRTLSVLVLTAAAAPSALTQTPAGGDFSATPVPGAERNAYQQIAWDKIPATLRNGVFQGRSLTRQTWVISPSLERDIAGLGPTYNRPSCLSCHPSNGRGEAPASPSDPMRGMLVRLSIPGKDAHGGPNPEPNYGDQLNELGVPGVPGEGEAFLEWQTRKELLADGSTVELRFPKIGFRKLAFGPLHAQAMTSVRIAPAIYGLGLLEAVPEADILEIAKSQKASKTGVAGQPNRVWDPKSQREMLGRFGWKANQPTTRQQIAGALAGDMGVTSDVAPNPNCPPVQTACAAVKAKAGEKHPEISTENLDNMALYHYALAVPEARRQEEPKVIQGKALFNAAGCALCHQPVLKTGAFPALPAISGQTIRPYTDLLLHDMGEGLADGRPDFLASGRQWRTPPLWGIGLAETVSGGKLALLHDGRARSFLEAILWHGGEGEKAKESVRKMSAEEREALLAFLGSL